MEIIKKSIENHWKSLEIQCKSIQINEKPLKIIWKSIENHWKSIEIQRKSLFIIAWQSPKNENSWKIHFFKISLDFLNRNLIGSDTGFFEIFWIPDLGIQNLLKIVENHWKTNENHRKSMKIYWKSLEIHRKSLKIYWKS